MTLRKRIARFVDWLDDDSAGRALADQALRLAAWERRAFLLTKEVGTSFHTLNALLDHAYERLDDEPKDAVALAGVVLDLIHAKPRGGAIGEMREHLHGRAWHEQANALRQTGDLLASLEAFQRAAKIFAADETAKVELAASKRGEALIHHHLGDSELALTMLRTATTVFDFHGDTAGVARCRLYEGVIHFENDRFESATASFRDALRLARRLGDEKTVAFLHQNLGNCALEQGNREAAIRDFARALEYFERRGPMSDRKRVAWGMAQLMIADGRIDAAIRALEDVAAAMEQSGLAVDAALARRDIVEVLVLAGQTDRASEIARGVLDTLAKAGMFRDAMRVVNVLQGAGERITGGRGGDHS